MSDKLKIRITGKSIDYYFKELLRNNINLYNLDKTKNKLEIVIDKRDYSKLLEIKTINKVEVIDRFGLSKFKYLINKFRLFIIFFIFGIVLNIFLSNIIFAVEIENSNKVLVKEIEDEVRKYGLKKYNFVLSNTRLNNLKKHLLENEDIEWLEIERIGTKYVIKVEMRKIPKKDSTCLARNIVAKKNAVITRFDITNGEIIKKKEDYVVKGETIVSGLIHNKETIKNKVCSTGNVYGKTWYRVKVSLPTSKLIRNKTGKKRFGIQIKILNKNYNLLNNFANFKINQYNIIESKIVPFNISFVKYLELDEKEKKLSLKELENIAQNMAEKKISKRLKKGERVLNKKILKNTINDSRIDIDVFVEAEENITDYFDISDINIDELNEANKKE